MFKFLWKMIKWTFVILVVLAGIGLLLPTDPEVEAKRTQARIAKCLVEIGADGCDENGRETQESKDKAKAKAEALAAFEERTKKNAAIAEKRIADAKQAEASRISSIERNGRLMCRHTVKQRVKYPSKLDYSWDYNEKLWENFNKDNASFPHRYVWNASGEMMNGFGNMVPFTVHCKLDLPAYGNGRIVDFWIK